MRQKLLAMLVASNAFAADDTEVIEEVTVWGQSAQRQGALAHPGSLLTQFWGSSGDSLLNRGVLGTVHLMLT